MSSTTSKPSCFPGRLVQKTLGRFPFLLTFLLFSALLSLLAALFFQAILSLFFPFPLFITVLLAAFMGLNLLLYAALPRPRFRQQWQQVALITAGCIAGVFLIEGGLRFINPIPTYQILPSNIRVEYLLNPELLPGLEERGLYTTNSIGIRGDEYREKGRYNILAIGGSTTETALLDDAKSWTYLLQTNLNQENGRPSTLNPDTSIWVGNVGRSGHGLVEHIHALQFFVPQHRFDAVILMVGINDFQPILQRPDQYHAHYEDPANYAFYLHRSFHKRPLRDPEMGRPFPENTAVWNLADISLWNFLSHAPKEIVIELPNARAYQTRQANYLAAPPLPNLPDLTPALIQYRANLLYLAALTKAQNIRLIFATQPAVWHENLSPEMERTLWLGIRGDIEAPDGRYNPTDLRAGLDQFNQTLLNVCREQAIECVDLAAEMTGHESYFYDDVHFNIAGGAKVAEILAAHIQQQPLQHD